MSDIPQALRPFTHYGLEFSIDGDNATCDCPFCDARGKFFVFAGEEQKGARAGGKDRAPGMFDCKRCGVRGNRYTFLTMYHELFFNNMVPSDLKTIMEYRGNVHSIALLRDHRLCLDDAGNVLFPIKNDSKNLVNLRRWSPKTRISYSTPGLCSMWELIRNETGPVYICEGEWDALSLQELARRAGVESLVSIYAAPGANTWKDNWNLKFKDRDVFLLYDNDHDKKDARGNVFNPGKDGMVRVTEFLTGVASSISCIDWSSIDHTDVSKDGYDVSDYLKGSLIASKPKFWWKRLNKACTKLESTVKKKKSREPETTAPVLERTSFTQVLEDFHSVYEFDQNFDDVLACCFAASVSLFTSDRRNPLWLFVVAPPSSGKTSIIEAFESATEYTIQTSKVTAAALVSGINMQAEDDYSLLNLVREKVLFIKDFTPILNMGPDREQVFGIFRDAYDGSYIGRYATGIKEYLDLHFGIVAGVTNSIDAVSMTEFGERFLKIRLIDDDFDERAHVQRAINNVGIRDEQKTLLMGATHGFLRHLITNSTDPVWSSDMDNRVIALAMIVAKLRTSVRNGKDILAPRPVSEVASRIATQLKKLALALARVKGVQEVDEDIFRIIFKVGMDSCVGWFLELVQTLAIDYNQPMTPDTLARKMDIHPNMVRKIIEGAIQIRIVCEYVETKKSFRKPGRGRKSSMYVITDELQGLLKESGASFESATRTPSSRTRRDNGKRTTE